MKQFLKNILFGGAFILFIASPVVAVVNPAVPTVSADEDCETRVLGIPPWYRGLTGSHPTCEIMSPNSVGGLETFIWRIVLNIVELVIVIVAYIAVFFIIYGGFLFMTGGSNAGQIEKARKTILNAVIGLVVAMGSIAITNLLFSVIADEGIPEMTGNELLTSVLNLVYFIAGVIAVIVIIVAGIMYTTSAGDSGRVTKAKNLLTYSIVGLIVVISAFAITNIVIGSFN